MPVPSITATSTVPMVKQQLVAVGTTALATASTSGGPLQMSYAWPGANADQETVFLGRHPDDPRNSLDFSQALAGINPGRRSRDEEYDVEISIWTFRPDLTAADAAAAELRAFTISALLENAFANDVRSGLTATATIHAIYVVRGVSVLQTEGSGWRCQLVLTVHVNARLV